MRDEAIATDPILPTAASAVLYLLRRIQVDANLRHYMLGTEAFHRLCVAEAERTRATVEDVKHRYSAPATQCADDLPRILECRDAIDKVLGLAGNTRHRWDDAAWRAAIGELESFGS